MKYLRLTATVPSSIAPRVLRVLAISEHVTETRTVALNVAGPDGATALMHVDGDREAVLEEIDGAPELVAAEAAPAPGGGFYLLLRLDPGAVGAMASMFELLASEGLVVVPPVRYRNGTVHGRFVGTASTVSDVVDALPDAIDVAVRAVREGGLAVESGAVRLSDRQREAVLAALELGYYDQPRRATHEDVAAALSCAPSTASEHLRKAEATLVRAAMA